MARQISGDISNNRAEMSPDMHFNFLVLCSLTIHFLHHSLNIELYLTESIVEKSRHFMIDFMDDGPYQHILHQVWPIVSTIIIIVSCMLYTCDMYVCF